MFLDMMKHHNISQIKAQNGSNVTEKHALEPHISKLFPTSSLPRTTVHGTLCISSCRLGSVSMQAWIHSRSWGEHTHRSEMAVFNNVKNLLGRWHFLFVCLLRTRDFSLNALWNVFEYLTMWRKRDIRIFPLFGIRRHLSFTVKVRIKL